MSLFGRIFWCSTSLAVFPGKCFGGNSVCLSVMILLDQRLLLDLRVEVLRTFYCWRLGAEWLEGKFVWAEVSGSKYESFGGFEKLVIEKCLVSLLLE